MDSENPSHEPQEGAAQETDAAAPAQRLGTVAPTGKRQAFRDIRRQLQEADLASPGVQKMLLEELEKAEAGCETLESYRDRFHDADKRCAVLEERFKAHDALEIFFGVGVGVGGAIIGLAPMFWSEGDAKGPIVLGIGLLLVIGAAVGRMVKR